MTSTDPARFAAQWISLWNARDAEAVLAQYADDVVFTSPRACKVLPETGGTVRGKDALRRYWKLALEGNPDLHFELAGVYSGIDTIVIQYRNQVGGLVSEVLIFRNNRVVEGHAMHLQPRG